MKLKWILTGLVAVVVAVVVAGYVVLSNLDLEQYREVIQAEAKKATGRELVLGGKIDLRVSLTPAITVEDVSLGSAPWGSRPLMVTLKRFELEASLLPLLSGDVQVKRLVLVEPDILLETDAEGRGNWEMGGPAAPAAETAEEGEGAMPALALSFDEISIENGSLTYRDGKTGQEQRVALDSLTGQAAGTSSPITLALAGRYNELDFALEGTLGSFDQFNSGNFPVKLTAEAAGATVTLDGRVMEPKTGQGIAFNITAKGEQLADLGVLAGTEIPALGAYEIATRIEQAGQAYKFSDLSARVGETEATGGLTLSLEGEAPAIRDLELAVATRGDSLSDIGKLVGTELPPIGPYDVSAKLQSQNGESFTLSDLAAKAGSSDISGQATVSLAGGRPIATAALTSDTLDLADFVPSQGEAGATGAGDAASKGDAGFVFSEDPLPLDALKAADADVTLQVATLRLPNKLELANLDLKLALKNGSLSITPVTAQLAGGTIVANVALNGAKQPATLKTTLKVENLDYGQLLRDLGIDDTVAGIMDVDVDLTGSGNSMRALASGLNGRSEIVSDEGVINSRLLKIVAVGLGDVLGPLLGGDKDAKLNCMISRFDIKNGLATSQALVIDTEVFTVSGGGTVDLKTEALDLSFDTETRQASIASLAVPFNVTGTLASPSVAPDPLGTALGIAKTAGMVINPVVGLGVLIGSKIADSASGDDNPCVVALNQGAQAEPAEESSGSTIEKVTEGAASAVEGVAEGAAGAVEGAVEGVTKGFKSLFGD